MEQQAHGLEVWMQPLAPLRAPKIFNLRSDPFERADHEAGGYDRWFVEHLFVLLPAQKFVDRATLDLPRLPATPKTRQLLDRQVMEMLTDQNSN